MAASPNLRWVQLGCFTRKHWDGNVSACILSRGHWLFWIDTWLIKGGCRGVTRSDRGYNVIDPQEGIAGGYPSLGECSTWCIRGVLEKNLWQGGKANFLTALRQLKNWVMGKKLQRGSWSDKKISDDPLSWKCWSFDKNFNCCHFKKIKLWNWT